MRELERGGTKSSASRRRPRSPPGLNPQVADQRQEVLSALREVRGARHPDLRVRGRARAARAVGAAGRRADRRGLLVLPRAEVRDPARLRAVGRPRGEAACSSGRTSTTRRARSRPKHYPKDIVNFANTRGADKVMYAGYFPMGLSLDRIFTEHARRAVPRPRVAEVPARERDARLQARRVTRDGVSRPRAAGGVVDTAVGIPKSREEMYEFYEFIRKQTRDAESKEGGELEFPAGYMFKDVPKWEADELGDPVELLVRRARPARHHAGDRQRRGRRPGSARCASTPTASSRHQRRPERGHGGGPQDRPLRRRVRPQVRSARSRPGLYPQVALNDKKFYPDLREVRRARRHVLRRPPACPDRASRSRRRTSRYIDEVCWFFPELQVRDPPRLRAVDRARGEAACSSGRTSTTRPPRSRRSTTRRTSSTSRTRAAPTR